MTGKNKNIIYPVIFKVPDAKRGLTGKDSLNILRQLARQAVMASAKKIRVNLPALLKDDAGAPMSSNGIFWSLSHKPCYVAGVAAHNPMGIDIEPVKPVQPSMFKRVLDTHEQSLSKGMDDLFFYRCWTAKEAVLKAVGVGLKGLSRCRIVQVIDKTHLQAEYQGSQWVLEHACHDNHMVSVIKNNTEIQWIFEDSVC